MAARKATGEGTRTDWIADRAMRGLIAGAHGLPYPARVAAMGRLSRRAVAPLAGYRRRALANLALIWPDMPEARRRAIAADCCAFFAGMTIAIFNS